MADDKAPPQAGEKPADPLSEKQRRELWLYLGVSICAVELLISVAALCFGFMTPSGNFTFPLLAWGAGMVMAPALILLAVHLADVGLFTSAKVESGDSEWQKHLPERLQRFYRIVKGAPALAVLLGVVALGAALLTLEGALDSLGGIGRALVPYIPHLAAGVALVLAVFIGAGAWLNYRTRRLHEEYAFRREVLERTGVVIVDKGSQALPGANGSMPPVLEAGQVFEAQALPPAEEDKEDNKGE